MKNRTDCRLGLIWKFDLLYCFNFFFAHTTKSKRECHLHEWIYWSNCMNEFIAYFSQPPRLTKIHGKKKIWETTQTTNHLQKRNKSIYYLTTIVISYSPQFLGSLNAWECLKSHRKKKKTHVKMLITKLQEVDKWTVLSNELETCSSTLINNCFDCHIFAIALEWLSF